MGTEIQLSEPPELAPLHFCLWAWMKSKAYKRKVGTRDELLARNSYAAAA